MSNVREQFMKRYLATLTGPILLLLFSAWLFHVSVLIPVAIILNAAIQIFALALGGWLLSTKLGFSVSKASFSGPALLFIDYFLFAYLPNVVFAPIPQLTDAITSNLILGKTSAAKENFVTLSKDFNELDLLAKWMICSDFGGFCWSSEGPY